MIDVSKLQEALFWVSAAGKMVKCLLCPHGCLIPQGRAGICGQRANIDGKLYSLNFRKCSSANVDPIEKKPLYHFYPGRMILSVGTVGCNLKCEFCQNWRISQTQAPTVLVDTDELIKKARETGSVGIAFTYNEPFIWYEFVLEGAVAFREAGMKVVLVTNGFVNPEPLAMLLPHVDAMNIDLKGFDNVFYTTICKGELAPVLATIQAVAAFGCHIEITNLVIPSKNDSREHIKTLVSWLASVNPAIPIHFSRYHPDYKFNVPETRKPFLRKARTIALRKLDYAYVGNVDDEELNSTFCPKCRQLLISRRSYRSEVLIDSPVCPNCGREQAIIM